MRSILPWLCLPPVALALARALPAQDPGACWVQPVTAPVRFGGTYHLGTGQWTRAPAREAASLPTALLGSAIVYDNTCNFGSGSGYFAAMPQGARFVDEGRLPSLSSPVLPNPFGPGNLSETGTQNSYTIDGFQISYCTAESTGRSYAIEFHEAYDACAIPPALPTAAFLVSGLPASPVSGQSTCWVVDVDLCASSLSFTMSADANQVYDGGVGGHGDTFGWSFSLLSPAPHGLDGFFWAGLYGGWASHCSASDGTVFDSAAISALYPENSDAIALGCGSLAAGAAPERGTGMGTTDYFRIENYPPLQDGCYWFGSGPGNFYLQLTSANVALPDLSLLSFCDPGWGGVAYCPCSNAPAGSARGCNNSANTGGASIHASGQASLAVDSLVLSTSGQRPTGLTILLQGTSTLAHGALLGMGVRCVDGTLRRLYFEQAVSGSTGFPPPGAPPVSTRSLALGDPIASGSRRYYSAWYRDPTVLGSCSASATFNCTNAMSVLWN